MVRRHNSREYSKHRKEKIRDYDEFYKVEVISYEHDLTKVYLVDDITNTGNAKKSSWKSWVTYMSNDEKQSFTLRVDYFVEMIGEYRIDIVYESFSADNLAGKFMGNPMMFEGSVNHTKRKELFTTWNTLGNQRVEFSLPKNCYFYGLIIRKTKEFTGDSLDSSGTNLLLEDIDYASSSQIGTKEASFTIAYDNSFEHLSTQTGLYMDYNDEVNVYIKEKGAELPTQVFGGYLSSILPDKDKTTLDISCADRLVDGQNKFILTKMRLLGGAALPEASEYDTPMDIDFDTYGQALKYLCNCLEISLNNNIGDNNLVTGETAKKGFNIEFGKNKVIKKVSCSNSTSAVSKNFITLRNNASAAKEQVMILYDGKTQGRRTPVDITDYDNFGIVYGMGKKKTEKEEKTTTTVTKDSSGAQKFNKCGVSADGKYLMTIGLPSACGESSRYGYTYYKRVYERKCPLCGSTDLVWDWHWNGTTNWGYSECRGNEEGGSAEGHVFCRGCDADFSIMDGRDHAYCGAKARLNPVSALVKSSATEAQQLKNGNFTSVPKTASTVTADDIFKEISSYAFKNFTYKLRGNTTSSASGLKQTGVGDCWAFSEWIFNELKKKKVNCKVVQYVTSESDAHRSVMYQNKKKKWVDFPYREYGWGSRYNNMLNNTSGSLHPSSTPFKYTAGGTIEQATGGTSTTTETTKLKIIEGYDRDNPIQGYFEVAISTGKSFKSKVETVQVGFTQKAGTPNSISGFSTVVWINDTVKQANVNLLKFVRESIYNDFDEKNRYYLHSIKFIAPINKKKDENGKTKVEDWYTYDKSTHDEASGKMDLYSINFNNSTLINPTDLESCGKNISSLFEDLIKSSKYTASMQYSKHRCDDIINFSVDNRTEPDYTATEGDDNNILEISGISFTPRNSLFNNSTVVFKDSSEKYKYVDTKSPVSVLKYMEQMNVITSTEKMGSKEAYYNALNNTSYNPEQTFNFSITLPYFVPLQVGDLVKVIANSKKLNTVKTVASVKYKCTYKDIPKIQTELGLGELPMDLQIAKELRDIRAMTKKETTTFTSTAEPIDDEDLYVWDT